MWNVRFNYTKNYKYNNINNIFNVFYLTIRLEIELKRLKCEYHSTCQAEKELKNQLNTTLCDYSNTSLELTKLKQEHEDSKSK